MACPRHQERIAFSYTALSDKDEHHTTVDQGSYLFRILRTRNKFHIFKVFYKKIKSNPGIQTKCAQIPDYTRENPRIYKSFTIITWETIDINIHYKELP